MSIDCKPANPVTPFTIIILIECTTSKPGSNIPHDMWTSPAANAARDWLIDSNMIDEALKATARGQAWLKFMCQTPHPIQTWILPDGGRRS